MIDEKQVEELKAKHGELRLLSADLEEGGYLDVIVRPPPRAQLGRFAEEVMRDPYRAMNNLFFECLVEPDADQMRTLFGRYPGLLLAFANRLLAMAKANVQVLEKKL